MASSASLLIVPFREVRHFQPDDCLHYEKIEVRGRQHGWTIPTHAHEALYQFEFLESGSVAANLDGYCHRLAAPAAWMIPPGVVHGFAFEPESSGHVISVPSAMLRDVTGDGRVSSQAIVVGPHLPHDSQGEIQKMFEAVSVEFKQQQPRRADALQAHALLLEIWFERRRTHATTRARKTDADAIVRNFRSLLEKHFREHRSVADYAEQLAITPDHLSRRCRIATGQSAIELIGERVLLESRRLLAYTQTPITDIAHDMGFNDPAYFSRYFAKAAGCSPSAYREAVADGLGPPPPRQP